MSKSLKTLIFLILILIIFYPFIRLSKLEKKREVNIIKGEIKNGDTLGEILKKEGIPEKEVNIIIEKLKQIFNVRKCKVGDEWQLHFDRKGNFLRFKYFKKPFNFYIVEKNKKDYLYYTEEIEKHKKIFCKAGTINFSLYDSMITLNINPEIIIQFAEVFQSKIDFLTDCQKNDKFSIIWESWTDKNGKIIKDIKVLAGKYALGNQKYYAFYFEKGDFSGYFDEDGKGVESGFLKAPLSYRKITSFFSHSRFHPIYKIWRPHLGIDYSAPVGTPVSAIGDGIIIFAGWLNGYGKCVKIKHSNGYISYYGHLNKIERGIKKGIKVKKGEVIGYVGMTGAATGPHLDFRIKKDGKFINFLKLKFIPEKNVPKYYMNDFEKIKNYYKPFLDKLF